MTMHTREKSRLIAILFRKLANELEALSDSDLEALAHGKQNILSTRDPVRSQKQESKEVAPGHVDIQIVRRQLEELSSREEGEKFLSTQVKHRADLVRLAKAIDIPVTKRHTVAQITEKIVEATIGFKTRSAAIRGERQS